MRIIGKKSKKPEEIKKNKWMNEMNEIDWKDNTEWKKQKKNN